MERLTIKDEMSESEDEIKKIPKKRKVENEDSEDSIDEFDEFVDENHDKYMKSFVDRLFEKLKPSMNRKLFSRLIIETVTSLNEIIVDDFELECLKTLCYDDETLRSLCELKVSIKDDFPDLKKIAQSQLSFDEKKDCYEKLNILMNLEKNTFDYFELKKELVKKLKIKHENEYETMKLISNEDPTIDKILNSNLSLEEKKECFQKFQIWMNLEKNTFDHVELRKELIQKLKIDDKFNHLRNTLMRTDIESMKERLLKIDASDDIQQLIYSKILKLSELEQHHHDYIPIKNDINFLLDLPFNKIKNIDLPIKEIKKRLDEKIFGLDDVKEQLLILLNNSLYTTDTKRSIALCGPPGVGKTSIAKAFAEAANLPFEIISLGGIKDSTVLFGSDAVWSRASPGFIVKALSRMKFSNGVILFDEVDKLMNEGMDLQNVLLHITDYTQNNNFRDKYLDSVPIDLSRIWFFFSMNDSTLLNNALKDRLPLIKISDYSLDEKKQILKNYILRDEIKKFNLDIELDDDLQNHIIKISSGVREMKHLVFDLISRIKFYEIKDKNIDKRIFERLIKKQSGEKILTYFM